MLHWKKKCLRLGKAALFLALLLFLAACGDNADPLSSPGATAPVWAENESTPAAVTEVPAAPAETAAPVTEPSAAAPVETAPPAAPETETPEPEDTPRPTERPEKIEEWTAQTARLLQPVKIYDAPEGKSDTLPAGTELLVGVDAEGEWLEARNGEESVWLHLDPENSYLIETPNGYLFLWVVLDGLDFS